MLSKTEDAWHASYICILHLTNTSNSRKNKVSFGGRGRFLLRLPSPTTIFWRRALEWQQHACLFYAASRRTVLCMCAFAVDILYMYIYNHVPHPKACMEGAVVSSTFSLNWASSAAQDVGTRNRTVMYMYNVRFVVQT